MGTKGFKGVLLLTLMIASLMVPAISTTTVSAPSTFSASPGATLSPTSARANTSIKFTVTVTNDYAADNIDNVLLKASGFTQPTDLKPTTWDLSEGTDYVRFDAIGDNVITPGGSETFVFFWTTPNIPADYMISVLVSKGEVTYTAYENLGGFIVTIDGKKPRAPIYIEGNDNFTPANGVVGGSGAENDPYIIENWDISAENANGICISNTTAHFVIRNCYVHGGKSKMIHGIYLEMVTNGKIVNDIVGDSTYCILLGWYSSNNLVSSNLLENSVDGIFLDRYSSNNLISNNIIRNNIKGIGIYVSSNNTIENNLLENNDLGISLEYADNNLITNNLLENNHVGILNGYDYTSSNNLIYHNNFVNNENQAIIWYFNFWDNGYPSGGNYWSDYTGEDNYLGENQDIPGSDGIGDTSYYVPGDSNRDRYPLMRPWGEPEAGIITVIYPTADVYAFSGYGTGYSRSQLKFDISSIPSGSQILSAKLWLYRLAADNWDWEILLNRVDDQLWSENITAIEFDAQTLTNEETRASKFISPGWDYLDLKNQLNVDHEAGHAYSSYRLRWANDNGGEPSVGIDDGRFLLIESELDELSIIFSSSEYNGRDPYLEVVYLRPYTVSVSISPTYKSGTLGEELSYTVMVANTGNLDDNYALTVDDNSGWGTTVSPTSLTIVAGASGTATLTVTIPEDAENGTDDNIIVMATSMGDPTVSDSASCIATVTVVRGVEVSVSPENKSGVPGETLTYWITVTNTGNVEETYDLEAIDNADWYLAVSPTSLTIPPNDNGTATLAVTIPEDAENGTEDNIIVTAISQADNAVRDNASCIAHAVGAELPVIEWDALITATFSGDSDDAIFGVRADATSGFDSEYDVPEPPAPPEPPYVRAYFYYPKQTPDELHHSYLAPENLMEWPLRIEYADNIENVTLTWSVENVPTEYNVLLYRGEDLIADMMAENNYTFEAVGENHDFRVLVGELLPFTLELAQGWNMISFPVLPVNSSPDAIFGSYYVLYRWDAENKRYVLHADSGSFIEPDPIVEVGVGYWAYVLENENVSPLGFPVNRLNLSLRQGWNLIGSTYNGSSIADPDDNPDNSVLTWAFTWNSREKGYSMTQLLEAGKGYWAYALRNCTLMLWPTAGAPATISVSRVGGIGFAGGIPTYSGIENIYIMQHKANSYDNTENLSGHENLQVWEGNTAVIEDAGLPAENIPPENAFDIVVAVKGHTDNMAYVNKENMYVRIVITNAFSADENTLDNDLRRYDFEDGTPTFIRTNHLFDNDGNGYRLGAGEHIDLTVYYYCYK